MKVVFSYTGNTKHETVSTETQTSDFYNLKNKSEGARRYGFVLKVVRFENSPSEVVFRGEFQTTLNGSRYQSSKYGEFVSTENEARASLVKTMTGALKRYAKLANNPVNKIEKR